MSRRLTYFIAVTLDGFIASPDGEFDGFLMEGDHMAALIAEYPDTLPTHFHAMAGVNPTGDRFDTVLMGWNTYGVGVAEGVDSPYQHLRQIVFSSHERPVPAGIMLVRDDPVATVRALKAADGNGIWLCGGGQLAATLSDEIDDLILKVSPVIFGAGIPLFGARAYQPERWERVEVRPFASGVTLIHLRRAR